jgi:hypothetical protein
MMSRLSSGTNENRHKRTAQRKVVRKLDEEKTRKEEKIKMAKKSLGKGLPIDLVSELTGLSKEEIEKL